MSSSGRKRRSREVEETSESSEGAPKEYYVERILKRRFDREHNCDLYLVKWQDYPDTANTWEPLDNLRKCKAELDDLYAREEREKKDQQLWEASGKRKAALVATTRNRKSMTELASSSGSRRNSRAGEGKKAPKKGSATERQGRYAISDSSSHSENEDNAGEEDTHSSTPAAWPEDDEPEVEPSDAGIPFDPDGPLVMIEPADGDDGFDRGWKMQAFVGLQLRPAAVGEGVREAWVGVKFAGYRRCQWIHISRVEEYEREALKQFLLQRLRASDFNYDPAVGTIGA